MGVHAEDLSYLWITRIANRKLWHQMVRIIVVNAVVIEKTLVSPVSDLILLIHKITILTIQSISLILGQAGLCGATNRFCVDFACVALMRPLCRRFWFLFAFFFCFSLILEMSGFGGN